MASRLRACVLTPAGRGAVATIRIEGELSRLDAAGLFRPRNGLPLFEQPIDGIVFGHWSSGADVPGERTAAEEVVLTRIRPDAVELHCHGGAAAVARIVEDLASGGTEIAPANEADWLAGSPVAWACGQLLLRATTRKTAALLVGQAAAWEAEIRRWPMLDGEARRRRIAEIEAWKRFADRLTSPWKIVLCGQPNVGKSSLMNAIAGFGRSIVHDTPGTTRDVVTLETAVDGWPVRFFDTAGLRTTADPLEQEGVRRARQAVAEADLVVGVFDLSQPPRPADEELWSELPPNALRVGNKSDLKVRWPLDRRSEMRPVSARTGAGLEELLQGISGRLVPALPPPGWPLPVSPEWRQWLETERRAGAMSPASPVGDGKDRPSP